MSVEVQAAQTGESKMVGGPGETVIPATAEKKQDTPKTETAQSAPIYFGGKKFSSVDELAQYTANIEREKQQYYDDLNRIKATVTPAEKEPDIEEEFWQSPKKALEKVRLAAKQEAKAEVLSEIEARSRAQSTRDKFYTEYTDLKAHEDLVEFYAARMQKELENVAPDEQLSKVAHAVRAKVASIKGTQVATEELPSRPAVTVGATSGKPTSVSVKQPTTFVEQLQALKQSRQRKQ